MNKDLTGRTFGKLTVIEKLNEKRNNYNLYSCKCDCGNPELLKITSTNLLRGKSTSCGCIRKEKLVQSCRERAEDITGKRFGTYTAIKPTEERKSKSVVWLFKCEKCGEYYKNTLAHMNSKKKPTCRCQRYIDGDITNMKFGRLTVLGKSDRQVGHTYLWECRCDCGNERLIYATKKDLQKGNVRSCGCYHSDSLIEDLSGKEFGYLRAEYVTDDRECGSAVWVCTCLLCGNTKKVSSANLKNGGVKSCGCHIKTLEYKAVQNPMGMNMKKLRKTDNDVQANNTSGYTGVPYSSRDDRWIACISAQGYTKKKYFITIEEAIEARRKMKAKVDEIIKQYDSLSEEERKAASEEYYHGEFERVAWIKQEINNMYPPKKR